jgi:hypothetical protein
MVKVESNAEIRRCSNFFISCNLKIRNIIFLIKYWFYKVEWLVVGVRLKMLPPLIGQEGGGFDWLTFLLPAIFCIMCMSMGQSRGEKPSEGGTESENWYTPKGIEESYDTIVVEAADWRKEAEISDRESSESFMGRLRGVLGGRPQPRYVVREEVKPRLFRMMDRTGPIYFELTEVEEGGTVIKATYNRAIKARVARMKAMQPLKIPKAPIASRCPACGKPTLEEFVLCPYCGEKLIKKKE